MTMALRGGGGGGEMPVKRGFMGRMLIKDLLERGEELVGGSDVRVCGWARTVRVQGAGSFAFLELNDGSCFQSIQIIADKCGPPSPHLQQQLQSTRTTTTATTTTTTTTTT